MMKSCAVFLCLAWGMSHPLFSSSRCRRYLPLSHLVAVSVIIRLTVIVLVCEKLLFYLMIAPKRKSSDTGNFNMLKRSCKVLVNVSLGD